jgi:hypothetical protein
MELGEELIVELELHEELVEELELGEELIVGMELGEELIVELELGEELIVGMELGEELIVELELHEELVEELVDELELGGVEMKFCAKLTVIFVDHFEILGKLHQLVFSRVVHQLQLHHRFFFVIMLLIATLRQQLLSTFDLNHTSMLLHDSLDHPFGTQSNS